MRAARRGQMMQGEVQDIFKPNFLGLFDNEENLVPLKAGEILFKKGDPASCMYVVLSGELQVGDGNKIFEHLSPGGLVGEMALIDHAPRAATVTALTDCTLAPIDEKRFIFLTQQTPTFALNVMRVLSQRLRRMDALLGG
jgi:CRP/FNR family cyclic AMP-dependent transcriptional regulator